MSPTPKAPTRLVRRRPPSATRLRRLSLGLTQAEVATLAGLSREQVGRVEVGAADPHVSTLRALAHALDCELADLLDDIEHS